MEGLGSSRGPLKKREVNMKRSASSPKDFHIRRGPLKKRKVEPVSEARGLQLLAIASRIRQPARAPKPQLLPKEQKKPNIGGDFFLVRQNFSREELKVALHKKSKQELEGTIFCLQSVQTSDSFNEKKQQIGLVERLAREAPPRKPSGKALGENLLEWFLNKDHVGSREEIDYLEKYVGRLKYNIEQTFYDKSKKRKRVEDAVIDRLNELSPNQLQVLLFFMKNREVFQRCVVREEQRDLIQEVINEKITH